jgi:hypothetical protein
LRAAAAIVLSGAFNTQVWHSAWSIGHLHNPKPGGAIEEAPAALPVTPPCG